MSKKELERVDKICPIFGTYLLPVPKIGLGINRPPELMAEIRITHCVREKCQLWDEALGNCRIALIAPSVSWLSKEMEGIVPALRDLVEIYRKAVIQTHGIS